MSAPGDDARRELERRALRNVRGLVDRMEEDERASAGAQKRILIAIAAVAIVLVAVIAAVAFYSERRMQGAPVDPSNLPPVRAGPPK